MPFLNQLTFPQLMWLVPILFAVHNLEEAPLMEKWAEKTPLPFHAQIKTAPFSIAVTFLTLLAFIVTRWGVNSPPQSLGVYLVVTLQAVILLNAFLPHMAVTIRYRSYNPELITAVFLNLPFSIYFFTRALSDNFITTQGTLLSLIFAPVVMIIFIAISLKLGEVVVRLFRK